jgi:hypothetical protein
MQCITRLRATVHMAFTKTSMTCEFTAGHLPSGAVKLDNVLSRTAPITVWHRMSNHSRLWKARPAAKDFEAAQHYLWLLYPAAHTKKLLQGLRSAKNVEHAAKDLLRASGLPLLPRDELHVEEDLKKIGKGKPLSPVLLVQGDMSKAAPLVIADGYHRICAVCHYDEDMPITCRLTRLTRK